MIKKQFDSALLNIMQNNYGNYYAWFLLFLSIVVNYSSLDESSINLYVSSDTLGFSTLYQDLFVNHGTLESWYLPASPSLFPDLTLYFSLFYFFKLNVLTTSFIYGIIQVTVLVSLMIYIYKKTVAPEYVKYSYFIPVFISFYFIEGFSFSHDYQLGYLLLGTGYHIGPFINTLLCLAVILSSINTYVKHFLFVFLVFVGAFSDMLFLVMLVAPLLLFLIVTIKKVNLKSTLIILSSLIIGSVMGLWLHQYLNENKFLIFMNPHRIYDLSNAIPSLLLFLNQMYTYIIVFGFRSFQIVFTIISIIFGIIFYFKFHKTEYEKTRWFFMFYVLFSACTFFAPIVNGNYSGYDTIRYNAAPFFLAAIPFAIIIANYIVPKFQSKISNTVITTGTLIFILLIALKFNSFGLTNYFNYYPDDVSEIDSVAQKHHLKKGIADYWTAKKTTVLSKKGVKVLAVHPDACLWELASNINWYYEGEFDFVITSSTESETFKTTFQIKDSIKTKNYTILLVDKFIYPKGKYAPINCLTQ